MIWTDQEKQALKTCYYDTPWDKLLSMLPGRTIKQCYNQAKKLGLKRLNGSKFAKGVRRSPGTEFKKGIPAHNKGKRQTEFMSRESIERTKKTRFKKGHTPHNAHEYGNVYKRGDHGAYYWWIKADDKAESLHWFLWRKHHGEKPKGHVIAFKDGNPDNCVIENLECITRAENMERNTIHRYKSNPELYKAMYALIGLKESITAQNKRQ